MIEFFSSSMMFLWDIHKFHKKSTLCPRSLVYIYDVAYIYDESYFKGLHFLDITVLSRKIVSPAAIIPPGLFFCKIYIPANVFFNSTFKFILTY